MPKNVFFGLGLRYDHGDGPSVGINVHLGKVVEIHRVLDDKDVSKLYSRVGMVDKATVHWPFDAQEYTQGVQQCVAVKPGKPVKAGDNVVEVHRSQGRHALFCMIGMIKDNRVEWKDPKEYTSGDRPAVALNNAGKVVEVHSSENDSGLWYRFGKVGTDNVDWEFDAKYDTGQEPRAAINDSDEVVEVHQSETSGTLWYHVGKIDEAKRKIDFGDSHRLASTGVDPSVALTDNGSVIVVYAEGVRLMQRFGQIDINAKTIKWTGDAVTYDDGAAPYVAAAGDRLSIEVHRGETLKTLWFSTSLITDRAKWMTEDRTRLGPRKMSQLVFPASHDSGMYPGGFAVLGKTQDLSILQQLEYGIRYFDLRPKWTGSKFIIHHGEFPTSISGPALSEVLADIQAYAKSGHKELVIITFSHFEEFDDTVYAKFSTEVDTSIGKWLHKAQLLPKQRLADITLNTYTANGTAIVVAVADNYAINVKKAGFWVFRNWNAKSADKGDLRVFDQYSDTTDYNQMKDNQLARFAAYNGNLLEFPGLPCDLFLLSWTLTPITAVWSFSKEPNRNLGQVMSTVKDANTFGKIINMLYVDYVQYARVTDVGITRNS